MSVHRYNFYLDEMIKRRNRYVISELERRGHSPWMISMETLFEFITGDRTIQMSSFMDIFDAAILT
ncbi:hypothetical protein P692DRAFT_20871819 [Suillus brevipes Sb2]|nr:hypothetical protein P692DRAFT_20871819 [Suillus brevipes Sb2]